MNPESMLLAASMVWAAAAFGFALAHNMILAVPALVLSGAALMVMINTLFSTFIAQLPDHLRGRGSSIGMLMAWLGTSVGAFAIMSSTYTLLLPFA